MEAWDQKSPRHSGVRSTCVAGSASNLFRFESRIPSDANNNARTWRALLFDMARLGGFEPPTAWFVARYSIQLSYSRVFSLNLCTDRLVRSQVLYPVGRRSGELQPRNFSEPLYDRLVRSQMLYPAGRCSGGLCPSPLAGPPSLCSGVRSTCAAGSSSNLFSVRILRTTQSKHING